MKYVKKISVLSLFSSSLEPLLFCALLKVFEFGYWREFSCEMANMMTMKLFDASKTGKLSCS